MTDRDQDGRPEITYTRGDHQVQTVWLGHRFEIAGRETIQLDHFTALDFGEEKSFSHILKALFFAQAFETALDLLADYDPAMDDYMSQPSREVGSHYLRGLAYAYLGQADAAQQALVTVVQDYADTTWVDLANEKLGQLESDE